jgi:glycerate kinase
MKIVIAPDSFKESLSAREAAAAIAAGFRESLPAADCRECPMADGGEGTVAAVIAATGGRVVEVRVTGPLGQPVAAFFGVTGDGRTAVIETAAASGLSLVPPSLRNPLKTTSYGSGELIRATLDAGLRRLLIGLGGSATSDAGVGLLQALGVRLLDAGGRDIGAGGEGLEALARIDVQGLDPRLNACTIQVACDVDNPLTGPRGAALVYAPQKGASPEVAARLDAGLARFADCLRRDLGREVAAIPGAGAAGGMGAALAGVLNAGLEPGIGMIMEMTGLPETLAGADLVVTGEGRLDAQPASGKVVSGVARLARPAGIPVIALAGSVAADAATLRSLGIDAAFSILSRPCSLEEALAGASADLRAAARNVAALIDRVRQLG